MSDKKHIDRLFKEKFKDFEAKPSASVWHNIQNQLEQPKKKRKIIPLWLRLTGVAVLLILFLGIGSFYLGKNTIEEKIEVVVETGTEKEAVNISPTSKKFLKNTIITTGVSNKKGGLSQKNKLNNNNFNGASNSSKSNTNNSVTKRNLQKNKAFFLKSNNTQYLTPSKQNSMNAPINRPQLVLKNNTKTQNNMSSALLAQKNTMSNAKDIKIENKIKKSPLNKSITEINTKKEKTNITPNKDVQAPNPLEEALLANTKKTVKEEEQNKWTINANAAPVYYNTFGKGSHIHEQFINNPKNGEINSSYGINVGYAVNTKLKLRSGINKLNLSYDTANVIVFESVSTTPSSRPMNSINFVPTNNGENISLISANDLSVQQVNTAFDDRLNAALSQRISYIEVPVELEFAIVNKRIGVNIIGGISTLILEGNEVVTELENRKTKIGEANNINTVSFTTNLGFGIDYKFSDNFKFNIEPTFKYQIKAYNETFGNFNPYIIGVYTGFSYKF